MMRYSIIFLLSSAIMLISTSCESEFELKGMDDEDRLHITFIPSTFMLPHEMAITGARSVNKPAQEYQSPSNLSIRLTADGEEIALEAKDQDHFLAHYEFIPGQIVRIEASADGFRPAYAETVIPEPVKEFKTTIVKSDEDYNSRLKVTVEYPDNPETKDVYGALVVCETVDTHTGTRFSETGDIYPIYDDFGETECRTASFNNFDIAYWNDSKETSGGRQKMEFEFTGTVYDAGSHTVEIKYQVLLLKVSPEFYRYYNGQWDADNNALSFIGLSAPTFTYTNIMGGIGVLGSISYAESGWIADPQD